LLGHDCHIKKITSDEIESAQRSPIICTWSSRVHLKKIARDQNTLLATTTTTTKKLHFQRDEERSCQTDPDR
jgi:hypothetical protein